NEIISSYAAKDATIIVGSAYDDDMADELRVTVVATGLGRKQPELVVNNGSDMEFEALTGTHGGNTDLYGGSFLNQPSGGRAPVPPTVIRSGRGGAAPNKAQFEQQVRAMESSGVERFDIPAFLRKQAD